MSYRRFMELGVFSPQIMHLGLDIGSKSLGSWTCRKTISLPRLHVRQNARQGVGAAAYPKNWLIHRRSSLDPLDATRWIAPIRWGPDMMCWRFLFFAWGFGDRCSSPHRAWLLMRSAPGVLSMASASTTRQGEPCAGVGHQRITLREGLFYTVQPPKISKNDAMICGDQTCQTTGDR